MDFSDVFKDLEDPLLQ